MIAHICFNNLISKPYQN